MRRISDISERIKQNTYHKINEEIQEKSLSNVKKYLYKEKREVSDRIRELDREWDTEKVLETNAAGLIILSTALGFAVSKKWFALAGAVGAFLLQQTIQGWSPPLPIIRKLGVRTKSEINNEKTILRFIRGDFRRLCKKSDVYPYRLKKDLF